jgi:transketolase C-terminal domain/subunit
MDVFGRSGKPEDLFAYYHLTADDIAAKASKMLAKGK